jgi:hypothetical protein
MDPFQKYAGQIERDQRMARLLRAMTRYAFDGTETDRVINAELRGLENEIAASAIRHAVVSQFRNTIPLDAVIEIAMALLETEEVES